MPSEPSVIRRWMQISSLGGITNKEIHKCDARFSTCWPVSVEWSWSVVLAVAGSLLLVGYSFANNYVHTQLAQQQITFPLGGGVRPPKAGSEITPSMIPSCLQYAGQQLPHGAAG